MKAPAFAAILAAIGALLTTWFQAVGRLEVATFLIMFGGFMVLLSASLGAANQNFRPAQSLISGFALVLLGCGFHWWSQKEVVADDKTKDVIADVQAGLDHAEWYANVGLRLATDTGTDAGNIHSNLAAANVELIKMGDALKKLGYVPNPRPLGK